MLTVNPLSMPFVGEINGADLRQPASPDIFEQILKAWASYPVLVFRDQDLSMDQQQAFAAGFGTLQSRARPMTERGANASANPNVMLVTNVADANGKPLGNQQNAYEFHSDGCFNEYPALATLLYGIEVPEHGGETLFVSMSQVYEALAAATRKRLSGKLAVNYYFVEYAGQAEAKSDASAEARQKPRHSIHPMVIAHPLTTRPMIFVNRHNTREIVGMDPDEAQPLLEEIFDTVERPDFIYAHKWRRGDLVVWDNRAVQHARADYPVNERRMLRRFAVRCADRPRAYVG
jgi:taurine dioxygenase